MRKLTRRALTAIAAVATTIAITAVPASAVSFTAPNSGLVALLDTNTSGVMVCQSSELAGDAHIGVVPIGTSLIDVATAGFSNCVVNGSIPATVTALSLPWSFIADSYSSGTTIGRLTGAALLVNMPSLSCEVTITTPGDVSGTYTNPSSILDLDDNDLVVSSTTGLCPSSLFNVNDSVWLKAQYQF